MLGSNLGKKVTAGLVQDQYKQFLKNKPDEKAKHLTPEERKEAKRAEMRKRGIFVKADDVDEVPTVLEKVEGLVQPMLFVLPEKPTVWKKNKTGARKTKKKMKSVDKKHDSEHRKKPTTPVAATPTAKVSKTNSIRLPPPAEPKPAKPSADEKTEESEKVKKKPRKEKSEKKVEVKVEEKHEIKEVAKKVEEKVEVKEPSPEPAPEPVKEVKSKEKVEAKKLEVEKAPDSSVKVEEKVEAKEKESEKEHDPSTATSAPLTSTISISELKPAEQRDAFDKLDDDEFEKMTSDADEKDILKLAPKLLKVAKRHAAIEKCLTAQENDTLAKFFSGKQKLDAHVLAVLDSALDKIIDYLQKNNCAVDEETKAVMKKRDKLKAAMMKEFLVSPQYLPKTWTAKFNEWKSEAEKQKNGINWFRVLFHYPKHKSFDDGPEDTFGNFRRRQRGLWIGILFGPGDVKSFEETKREDDCQGMFLDTKTMENAVHEKDSVTGRSSQTSITGEVPSAKK